MMSDPDVHPGKRVWTISNLLSCSRIVLALPIIMLLLQGTFYSRLWAVLLMLIAVATDFLDGYIARKRNEVTELGKIIDPLADKISVAGIAFVLAIAQYLPLWYFLLVLFRDALILMGGLWLMRTRKIVLQSNWIGKWTVNAVAATVVAATLMIGTLVEILMGISCILLLWSFVSYIRRFFEVLGKKT